MNAYRLCALFFHEHVYSASHSFRNFFSFSEAITFVG